MRYVLDSNIVSALMRGDPGVIEQLSQLRRDEVLLPQAVLSEIRYGLERLPRSKRRLGLEREFERIAMTLPRSSWTDEVSDRFGALKARLDSKGTALEDFDLAIAAHALAENAVLVTANTRHFDRVPGLELRNWLESH